MILVRAARRGERQRRCTRRIRVAARRVTGRIADARRRVDVGRKRIDAGAIDAFFRNVVSRGERPVARLDSPILLVVDHCIGVEALDREVAVARSCGEVLCIAAGMLGRIVLCVRFGALKVLAQDEIDHAGDGVTAIDRRRAVFQDLDALHRGQRNGVQVATEGGECPVGDAAAVNQYERSLIAEPAQRSAGKSRHSETTRPPGPR